MVAVPPQTPTNLTQLTPERRRRQTDALLLELADQSLGALTRASLDHLGRKTGSLDIDKLALKFLREKRRPSLCRMLLRNSVPSANHEDRPRVVWFAVMRQMSRVGRS
jgi:hypothetical protein